MTIAMRLALVCVSTAMLGVWICIASAAIGHTTRWAKWSNDLLLAGSFATLVGMGGATTIMVLAMLLGW